MRHVRSEAWRERAPSQRERILEDLRGGGGWDVRGAGGGWVCSLRWNKGGILRYGARIWELRHAEHHEIEERICEHKVLRYRLAYDADWDREP